LTVFGKNWYLLK